MISSSSSHRRGTLRSIAFAALAVVLTLQGIAAAPVKSGKSGKQRQSGGKSSGSGGGESGAGLPEIPVLGQFLGGSGSGSGSDSGSGAGLSGLPIPFLGGATSGAGKSGKSGKSGRSGRAGKSAKAGAGLADIPVLGQFLGGSGSGSGSDSGSGAGLAGLPIPFLGDAASGSGALNADSIASLFAPAAQTAGVDPNDAADLFGQAAQAFGVDPNDAASAIAPLSGLVPGADSTDSGTAGKGTASLLNPLSALGNLV